MIYSLYLKGYGLKEIARELNQTAFKTPAQLKYEKYEESRLNFESQKKSGYLWGYTSVKNILRAECYTGTLINHRWETFGVRTAGLYQRKISSGTRMCIRL